MNLENLDAKLTRVKSECDAVKQAKDVLENEYENYKVFVRHSEDTLSGKLANFKNAINSCK